MTGTEAETAAPEPELTVEEYAAQLKELEARFPAPTWEDVQPEWKWIYEAEANNTFDPTGKYCGLNVAIYGQKVVGTDPHWMRLRVRLSRELGVHPERIVIRSLIDVYGYSG
jgi:hypothetical protein